MFRYILFPSMVMFSNIIFVSAFYDMGPKSKVIPIYYNVVLCDFHLELH